MRHVALRVAWVAAVLVLAAGCKKSNTAADVSVADEVVLVDKGDRPRSELRYSVAAGTTTSSTTTLRLTSRASTNGGTSRTELPGFRLDTVSGPAELTEQGVKFAVDVVKAEVLLPADLPEELAKDFEKLAAAAEGIGGFIEVDDRGRQVAADLNEASKRGYIPLRLLRALVNARNTLTRVPLPDGKVGLGAVWEHRRTITAYGIALEQVSTYKLVDRAGDDVMLDVTAKRSAPPQSIEFPEDGIQIAIRSLASDATGQIVLDLRALASDASATGVSEDHVVVKTPKSTEAIDIREEFEIQIANTTSLTQ